MNHVNESAKIYSQILLSMSLKPKIKNLGALSNVNNLETPFQVCKNKIPLHTLLNCFFTESSHNILMATRKMMNLPLLSS